MGRLLYGPQQRSIEIDDRALAHLKIVILSKLRRAESFTFSWETSPADGGGRGTIWLHPAIPLEFVFVEDTRPTLNRAWVEALTRNSDRGDIHLEAEPEPPDDSRAVTTKGRW